MSSVLTFKKFTMSKGDRQLDSYNQYQWSYGEDNTCNKINQNQGKNHPKRVEETLPGSSLKAGDCACSHPSN